MNSTNTTAAAKPKRKIDLSKNQNKNECKKDSTKPCAKECHEIYAKQKKDKNSLTGSDRATIWACDKFAKGEDIFDKGPQNYTSLAEDFGKLGGKMT
jgi:hypothetical protein